MATVDNVAGAMVMSDEESTKQRQRLKDRSLVKEARKRTR